MHDAHVMEFYRIRFFYCRECGHAVLSNRNSQKPPRHCRRKMTERNDLGVAGT